MSLLQSRAATSASCRLAFFGPFALMCALGPAAFAAEKDAGMMAFNNHCRQCHSYQKDDHRLGPSLHGIVGRRAGTAEGFGNYSPTMKNSGLVWTPENLDKLIANSEALLPNNNMKPFTGIADAGMRSEIVAFLQTISEKQPPGGTPPAK